MKISTSHHQSNHGPKAGCPPAARACIWPGRPARLGESKPSSGSLPHWQRPRKTMMLTWSGLRAEPCASRSKTGSAATTMSLSRASGPPARAAATATDRDCAGEPGRWWRAHPGTGGRGGCGRGRDSWPAPCRRPPAARRGRPWPASCIRATSAT